MKNWCQSQGHARAAPRAWSVLGQLGITETFLLLTPEGSPPGSWTHTEDVPLPPRLLHDKAQNKGIIHRRRQWSWAAKKAVSNNNQGVGKKIMSNHMSVEKNIMRHLSAPTGAGLAKLVSIWEFKCMASERGKTDTVLHRESFYLLLQF